MVNVDFAQRKSREMTASDLAMEGYERLANKLETDRTIKVYVGDSKSPYLVSQTMLCARYEYFVKAIENAEKMGPDGPDILRFPEDDEQAWQLILYWMMGGVVLPRGKTLRAADHTVEFQGLLCRTWILADKYFMPALQNATMTILLSHLRNDVYDLRADVAVNALRVHNASSALGLLACAALVQHAFGPGRDGGEPKDLKAIEGVPGAVFSIANAVHSFNKKSVEVLGRNGLPCGRKWPEIVPKSRFWEQCMVKEC